jgi:hypothetical protein
MFVRKRSWGLHSSSQHHKYLNNEQLNFRIFFTDLADTFGLQERHVETLTYYALHTTSQGS